jgi:DNA-binding CsgD family transcriptional regulator
VADSDALVRGRTAYEARWRSAHDEFCAADLRQSLGAPDLHRVAVAAHLLGLAVESEHFWARAHREYLAAGAVAPAVRCAFWLSYSLLNRGEGGPASGWLARGQRLLADRPTDCVEHGYVLFPGGLQALDQGDAASAYACFDQVVKLGERFDDPDLIAMGRLGAGTALIRIGEVGAGFASFDEAMVAIAIAEVSPMTVGIVYCGVIDECQANFDLRRAREWTEALSRWCDAQPDLVPFRGQCLVHRAQLLQLRGDWASAMLEVNRACERLATPAGQPALGLARYQRAELHRLRGDFAKADADYRYARECGHRCQPGMALLLLARGDIDGAVAAIRVSLDQTAAAHERPKLLAGAVEIHLAAGATEAARVAVNELRDIASGSPMPFLLALTNHCEGAVTLAEGQAARVLTQLLHSCDLWRQLDAPYELARTRELVARAYRELGDAATAQMELDAAGRALQKLTAGPDLARLRVNATDERSRLTVREAEVLRLVAAGLTNRSIAVELAISEHTVARHLQNMFTKLDLPSRTAATAYAYEHGLIGPSTGQN